VEQEQEPSKRSRWPKLWAWTGFGEKKLWDWLQLLSALAIPVVLAAAGFWFTAQQEAHQLAIEDHRAEAERELAQQRAKDEALQAFLEQMGQLLLEKKLRTSKEGSAVMTLAKARTVTALQRLDANHNRIILRFLREAKLIRAEPERRHGEHSVVSLTSANLEGADLKGADLHSLDLEDADLTGADLTGANLRDTYLHSIQLERANLQGADLTSAVLNDAKVTDEQLAKCKTLEGATMPDGQTLKRDDNPDGPTLKEWLKSKGKGEK